MPISSKQQKILAFPFSNKFQAIICDGAVRSGKTSVMTVAFVDWAMRDFNLSNFAICSKTVGSAIRNIVQPFLSLHYAIEKYSISFSRADSKMTVRFNGRTNFFYIFGGKDDASAMLIQGITLAGVFLDEVALMSRAFVEEAIARCLTFPNRRFWFSCNPESPSHWFYKEWISQPHKHKALYLHFLMSDNPVLPPDALNQAKLDFSGVFYERKVLGKWVKAEGLVYPMFDPKLHLFKPNPPFSCSEYQISIDYGTFNPFHALLWGLDPISNAWLCLKEFRYSGRLAPQKDPTQYLADILDLAGTLPLKRIIIDPSADAFITLLRNNGLRVTLADNAVLPGIEAVASALNSRIIKFSDSCLHLISEFSLYSWDSNSNKDSPAKDHDHGMDALRYFVYTNKLARQRRKYLGE